MKTLTLQQGSAEWLAHRRTTRNASEASVMMGAFPTFPRRELVRLRATGMEREYSDYVQKHILDRGHQVEPALRELAEKIVGDEFYPVTGTSDDGYLGASFDGVTLLEDAILEAKQFSVEKIALVSEDQIPPQDYWQIVQQFAVCQSAQLCIYIVGDGTEESTRYMRIPRSRIEADIPKLVAAWTQFDADVASYVYEPEATPVAAGRAPDSLPALSIQVTGMVTASNLADYKAGALAVLAGINRNLQTDDDFANAEQTVKWCKGVEDRLEATKQQVLGQTADIDAVFRTMDEVSAETRRIRLELDKLVTKEKENRRLEIVTRGRDAYTQHVDALRAETKGVWLPLTAPDFAGAIKGKRTLSSTKDAVDTALANGKIAANESAKHIRAALACLSEETADHKHLLPDYLSFIAKPVDDIRSLVRGRIAEHQQREQEKLEAERERIRLEEVAKLERQQQEDAARIERERAQAELDAAKSSQEGADLSPPAQALHEAEGATRFASAHPSVAKVAPSTATLKLGDINDLIAPLSISAEGLASLGFKPVASKGSAKHYPADDFPHICGALARVVAEAPARAALKKAA